MKAVLVIALTLLVGGVNALAQQDPDDNGLQDSIIIGSVDCDTSDHSVVMYVYAVTDDSVTYYNIPLTWRVVEGAIQGDSVGSYFSPLDSWDLTFDSTMTNPDYMRIFGFCDLMYDSTNFALVTYGLRRPIMTLHFTVEYSPRHPIIIDTTYDGRSGSLLLGLSDGLREITPAFRPGYIGIYVGIGESDPVSAFTLSQNYPNPFNPSTEIEFTLPVSGWARLEIYDILGQTVRKLVDNDMEAGNFAVTWDGKNEFGLDVPSGTYFYRLTSANLSETKKMTLLK